MKSPIDAIYDSETLTDEQKKDQLYNKIKYLLTYLTTIRDAMANETTKLDDLMNANGNNPSEHHAKTMVFYGRKLSVRDIVRGVTTSDPSYTDPPEVSPFTGIDRIISENDYGRVTFTWDCTKGMLNGELINMSAVYKPDEEPHQPTLTQKHMLGSKVTMPSIRNLDTDGTGAGTNTYKLKSGYTINGWVYDTTSGTYYLSDDTGNDFLYRYSGETKQPVVDMRVFAFGSNAYKIPFNTQRKYNNIPLVPTSVKLYLDIVAVWFSIEFIIRHGTASDTAPCKVPIKTRLGNSVILPQTTLISMDTGYKIDTSVSPYGQWTTVDPNTGTSQTDPDGDPITDKDFIAGTTQIVGTDLDAGIRRLYLKITSV